MNTDNLIKVRIVEEPDVSNGWPPGTVGWWDRDKVSDAPMNDGGVVWDEGMTDYFWHNPETDLEIL